MSNTAREKFRKETIINDMRPITKCIIEGKHKVKLEYVPEDVVG